MNYQGYGYSIWLVPSNWRNIKKDFSIDFLPHITVATNLPYISSKTLSKESFLVNNFSVGKVFSKMYKYEPLYAFGYECYIEDLYTSHMPHMTLFYSPNEIKYLDTFSKFKSPPQSLTCNLFVADTRSLNPSEWRIIY
jgi:hypothetical protein